MSDEVKRYEINHLRDGYHEIVRNDDALVFLSGVMILASDHDAAVSKLQARINELSNGIRDEVVRRYYRQDLAERLQRTFAPDGGRGGYGRGSFGSAGGRESPRRFAPRGGFNQGQAGR